MNSSSSSSLSGSPVGTPHNRSRAASDASDGRPPVPTNHSPSLPVQTVAEPAGCWNGFLCRPNGQDIELTDVVTDGSSQKPEPKPMRAPRPSLRTKWQFDPSTHLTLDEKGLGPNYQYIGGSLTASEREITELLNLALEYANSAPLVFPRGFDPAKHVGPDGTPDIPAILNDASLSQADKIDIYRAARAYVRGTASDPRYVSTVCVMGSMPVAFMLLMTGVILAAIYLPRLTADTGSCRYHPMNDTQTEAFMQEVRQQFPQLVNQTLTNLDAWGPVIRDHFLPDTALDSSGQLLQRVCSSAGQALGPAFPVLVLLALQMLLFA